MDVCKHLGYAHAGSALRNVADATNFAAAETVLQAHCLSIPAGREWLGRIADTLGLIADRMRPPAPVPPRPTMTPQQLLATWRAKSLVVIEDVHAVAAYLAPALVRGPVHCRLDEVSERTGLTLDRGHDCLRMLIKGGVRQAGVAAEGVPVYVLP